MLKVSKIKFAPAMTLASPGCAWRHLNIGVKQSNLLTEDYFESGSCVGGFI